MARRDLSKRGDREWHGERYDTAAQLGPTGLTADGTYIARPFPASGGEFPLRQSTFFAPGAPTTWWIGTQVRF